MAKTPASSGAFRRPRLAVCTGVPTVLMVQATEDGHRNDPSTPTNRSMDWGVFVQRQISPDNGAQNFHSFRTGHRSPRCTDRSMSKFQPRSSRKGKKFI